MIEYSGVRVRASIKSIKKSNNESLDRVEKV